MATRKNKGRLLTRRVAMCNRCKAPIVWARTVASENGPGGKAMPLDPYPTLEGNVAVRRGPGGSLYARALKRGESHVHGDEERAMPHAATCGIAAGQQLADEAEAFLKANVEGGNDA